jgi:superfamily II DNA or RNA helicase
MAWLSRHDAGPSLVKRCLRDLTVKPKSSGYGEEPKPLKFYEVTKDSIGVPRGYFLERMAARTDFDDLTQYSCDPEYPHFVGSLRTGQSAAAESVLKRLGRKKGRFGGILQAKCGYGKTVTALYIASQVRTPAVVLLHKDDLMEQWEEEIEGFLPDAAVFKARACDPAGYRDADVVLAMYQTLHSRAKQYSEEGFFEHFGLVIADECHRSPARTTEETLRRFNGRYRLGLTATPRRRDGLQCMLKWAIGPTLAVMGGVSNKGKFIQVDWKAKIPKKKVTMYRGKVNTGKLITLISQDKLRNSYILKQVHRAAEGGRRVLVLSDRVEHLKGMRESFSKRLQKPMTCALYLGGMKKAQLTISAKADVIFATFGMLSEGTDLPSLDTLFLATPRGDIEQIVGRIQRPEGRTPFVVDVVDSGNQFCVALSRKRKRQYQQLGFMPISMR